MIKRDNFNIKDNKQHARQEVLHGETPFGRFNFLNAAFVRCELLRRWFLRSKNGSQDHDQCTEEDSKRDQNKNGECSHGRDPSFLYMIICHNMSGTGAGTYVSFLHYLKRMVA